jgi:hypothetical protein
MDSLSPRNAESKSPKRGDATFCSPLCCRKDLSKDSLPLLATGLSPGWLVSLRNVDGESVVSEGIRPNN